MRRGVGRSFGGLQVFALVLCLFSGLGAWASEGDPQRGYELLVNKAYLPPDLDQEVFDELWKIWPEPLRSQAESLSPEERRELAFQRYGLTSRPGDESGKPLQYVVDEQGRWSMNCFACHAGEVAGQVVPGAPNSRYALQTLVEDVRATKLRLGKPLGHMDVGSFFMPLGTTLGNTNAVMFGVALMASRDAKLNVIEGRMPKMVHHDMDTPAWWYFYKRDRLYIDGFAEKGHRALMQFVLVKQNGPDKFREWEEDFRHVLAYMESLRAPRWPFAVDTALAEQGEQVFLRRCAECHGVYGNEHEYPGRVVPLEELGTDPVRLEALTVQNRRDYGRSWFAHFGEQETIAEPIGYLAPPLDGIWASAPYFHNGAVPTLWHVLHPDERPKVWRRRGTEFDPRRVGPAIETYSQIPPEVVRRDELREYYDTSQFGKSADGHWYPDELSPSEKEAVLEYLKTL